MKKLLILLLISQQIFATDYYITSTGNNTTGLSPANGWQNITKLNASLSSVKAGDRVLFNRGETFYGQINLFRSGTAGNNITFGAYGTGVKPVITGFTTITSGWTSEGGGIYSKVITSDAQTNMVTIDGISYGMGRFPDASYLTYQTFSTNTSITSSSLTGTPNYTGSEVVIRKNDWTLDRCNITSQSTGTLIYTSLGTTSVSTNNYGFFLQNGLQFVTAYGEWWHDFASTGKFYMYFGGVNPNIVVVNVATKTYGINNSRSFDYIVMDNLTITGTIIHGIHNNGVATNCVVQNCTVKNAGGAGIRFNGGTLNLVIKDTIINCNYTGVEDNGTFSSITNCYVYNIGMVLGSALGGSVYSAIFSSNGGTIINNFIRNAGYNGIIMKYGGTVLIQNNIVDSTCVLLNDGGGIYTPAASSYIRYIDGNVVTNVIGNFSGTTGTIGNSAGIYLDEAASNCRVTNNIIINIPSFSGIKMHRANACLIRNNTTYNCSKGLDMLDFTGNIMRNDTIRGNTFFAVTSTQLALEYRSNDNNITLVGLMDSNYYARPIDDNLIFRYKLLANGTYQTTDLAGWKTLTTKETASHKAPKTIASTSELNFQCNATNSPVVYNFKGLKKILMNVSNVNNSIAIPAWGSVILFDNGFSPPTNYIIKGIR